RGTGLVELGLRGKEVEQRRGTEIVALLLHAKIFLRGEHGRALDTDAFLRGAQCPGLLHEALLRGESGVAELCRRVVLGHARADDLILAREVVEERKVEAEVEIGSVE